MLLPSLHRLSANQYGGGARPPVGTFGDDGSGGEGEGEGEGEALPKRPRGPPASPPGARAGPGPGSGPGPGPEPEPELAGVVLFFVAERRALAPVLFLQELRSLGVVPRTGVGLVHAMLQHPDAQGQEEVQLVVRRDNDAANAFYERLGFELLTEPGRRAFAPLRDLEVCMTSRRAALAMRTEALLGAAPLKYATHRNKAAFVLQDMWRFKKVVATLQASSAGRGGSVRPARVLPGDPRVRYVVATTVPRDTVSRGAI